MWSYGYHYTSLNNWRSIHSSGLRCCKLTNQYVCRELTNAGLSEKDLYGIWLWKRKPMKRQHAIISIWQASRMGNPRLALLKVQYDSKWCLSKIGKHKVSFKNAHVSCENLDTGECPSILIMKDIPPQNIELLQTIDFIKLLQR